MHKTKTYRIYHKDEHHKKDEVCVDKECKLSWLRGRHFSISADLAVAGWCCLLARMVTEVNSTFSFGPEPTLIEKSLGSLAFGLDTRHGDRVSWPTLKVDRDNC